MSRLFTFLGSDRLIFWILLGFLGPLLDFLQTTRTEPERNSEQTSFMRALGEEHPRGSLGIGWGGGPPLRGGQPQIVGPHPNLGL